eukprot:3548541-Rhodomonas_salina.1
MVRRGCTTGLQWPQAQAESLSPGAPESESSGSGSLAGALGRRGRAVRGRLPVPQPGSAKTHRAFAPASARSLRLDVDMPRRRTVAQQDDLRPTTFTCEPHQRLPWTVCQSTTSLQQMKIQPNCLHFLNVNGFVLLLGRSERDSEQAGTPAHYGPQFVFWYLPESRCAVAVQSGETQ